MKTLLASLALLLPVAAQAAPAKTAAKPMAVCVAKATGVVTARPKCKAGESPLSLAAVAASAVGPTGPQGPVGPKGEAGPQGPAGKFDLATCYKKDLNFTALVGLGSPSLECTNKTTDFMLSEGIDLGFSLSDIPAIVEKKLIFDGTSPVPVGVSYFTSYWLGGGAQYQGTLTVVCCKR